MLALVQDTGKKLSWTSRKCCERVQLSQCYTSGHEVGSGEEPGKCIIGCGLQVSQMFVGGEGRARRNSIEREITGSQNSMAPLGASSCWNLGV